MLALFAVAVAIMQAIVLYLLLQSVYVTGPCVGPGCKSTTFVLAVPTAWLPKRNMKCSLTEGHV